jgi:hypothetical protein
MMMLLGVVHIDLEIDVISISCSSGFGLRFEPFSDLKNANQFDGHSPAA